MKSRWKVISLFPFLCQFTIIINGYKDKITNIPKKVQDSTTFVIPAKPSDSVTPVQEQWYICPNSSDSHQFWNQNVAISYLLSFSHLVDIIIDGNDIDPSIQPFVGRYNKSGEKIWFFDTGNSSDVHVEAHVQGIGSRSGKKKL